MAFLGANRLGKAMMGLRGWGHTAYNYGKYGADLALANRNAALSTMAVGAGLYGASRFSDNKFIRGVGDAGLIGAGGVGFLGARKGLFGMGARRLAGRAEDAYDYAAHKVNVGYRYGRAAGSRMRRGM